MMQPSDIIQEIQRLPIQQRLDILEAILRSIRKSEEDKQILQACAELQDDYANDKDLTAFNVLDFEDFYEPKRNLAR